MNITKELFVSAIESLRKQEQQDMMVSGSLKLAFNGAFVRYDNDELTSCITKLLSTLTDDENDWIDYYIYELDFGEGWVSGMVMDDGEDVRLKTAGDLWDFVTKNVKK